MQQNDRFPQGVQDASESDCMSPRSRKGQCVYPAHLQESLQLIRSRKSIAAQTFAFVCARRRARSSAPRCARTVERTAQGCTGPETCPAQGLQKEILQEKKNNGGEESAEPGRRKRIKERT